MKKHTKLLALLLFVVLIVGVLAVGVFAETAEVSPNAQTDKYAIEQGGKITPYNGTEDELITAVNALTSPATVHFYQNFNLNNTILQPKTNIVFNLHQNTLTIAKQKARPNYGITLEFTNGTLKDCENQAFYFDEWKKNVTLKFTGIHFEGQNGILEFRIGTLIIDGCTAKIGRSFVSSLYRGENVNITIKNTKIELTKANNLISFGRSGTNSPIGKYTANITLDNVQVTNNLTSLLYIGKDGANNNPDLKNSVINVTVKNNCSFANDGSQLINVNSNTGITNVTVNLADGTKFQKQPADQKVGKIVFPEGSGYLTTPDGCEVGKATNLAKVTFVYNGKSEVVEVPKGFAPTAPVNSYTVGNTTYFIGWRTTEATGAPLAQLPACQGGETFYAVTEDEYLLATVNKGSTVLKYIDNGAMQLNSVLNNGSKITLYKDTTVTTASVGTTTIDLNGHTLKFLGRLNLNSADVLTVQNGKIITEKSEAVFISDSKNSGTTVNFINCDIICGTKLVDIRGGYINVENCNVELLTYAFLCLGSREEKANANIINTKITSARADSIIFDLSRNTSSADPEKGALVADINCDGLTVVGKIGSLLRFTGVESQSANTGISNSKITVLCKSNCAFDEMDIFININESTKVPASNTKITLENGVRLKNELNRNTATFILGKGNSILIPEGDYFEVANALTDGEIYVNIDSDVNLVYVLPYEKGTNPIATFTFVTGDGTFTREVKGVYIGEGRYAFKYTNIDPRYFGDRITFKVSPEPNVSYATETSIKEYLVKVMQKYSDNDRLQMLASDILRYGACAQLYTGYKTNALVTDGLSLVPQADVSITNSIFETNASKNANYQILGSALRLQGEMNMIISLKLKSTEKVVLGVKINGRYEEIAITDYNRQGDGTYQVIIENIGAYEFADAMTVSLLVDGAILDSITYSVNSYIYDRGNMSGVSLEELNLLQAIANYGRSAKEYKNYTSVPTVSYAQYGAVGDGITDDFYAIKRAHADANKNGYRVVAESGKTYNLGLHNDSISIKTDTDFKDAKFLIDDSAIGLNDSIRYNNVIRVESESKSVVLTGKIKSLKENQSNIGIRLAEKSLVYIENSNKKQYIRYGKNQNAGHSMQEVILVDKNGNVDKSTPIMWNYDTVTKVVAYPVNDAPITIKGGVFETKVARFTANTRPDKYWQYNRNIKITRSNVTVKGTQHTIINEGDPTKGVYGVAYGPFFDQHYVTNIMYDSIILQGHRTYQPKDGINMGSYEIGGGHSNNVTWKNVTQTHGINDDRYWGVMGSNYCKNLTYDGCKLSRFDAHCGVYNAKVINSEIGSRHINAIGKGTFQIENTTVHSNSAIDLREDYGSTWDGDMIFRNVTLMNTADVSLFTGSWTDWNFGYECHLPTNIVIDGIKLNKRANCYVFSSFASLKENNVNSKNPYFLTQNITVSGNMQNVININVSVNAYLSEKIKITKI